MKIANRLIIGLTLTALVGISLSFREEEDIVPDNNLIVTSMFNISANTQAPVFEKQQIVIEAEPAKVWQALTEIDQWPAWQKNVTSAKLNGGLLVGTLFDWKAGGLSFKSRIHTCQSMQYFGWTGKTIGASAIHNWQITAHERGTLVQVEESLDGVLPRFFSGKFSAMLKTGMLENLNELKDRAMKL